MEAMDNFAPDLKSEGTDASNATAVILHCMLCELNRSFLERGGTEVRFEDLLKTIILGMGITYLEVKHGFKK